MAADYLTGQSLKDSDTFLISQCDSEGRWRRRRLSLGEMAAFVLTLQGGRDAAQDAVLSAERQARIAADTAEATARQSADGGFGTRVGTLESRPEEAAHFVATKTLPTIAALASTTLVLTGLVPARTGDVLRAGETVVVEPTAPLPTGINIAGAVATADGTVALQITASVAVTTGPAIVWNITALR